MAFSNKDKMSSCLLTEPNVTKVGCTFPRMSQKSKSFTAGLVFSFSIEGEYVPVEGDEVTYKVSRIPPKNLKVQAVEVKITHLNPGTKHETWSGQIISS